MCRGLRYYVMWWIQLEFLRRIGYLPRRQEKLKCCRKLRRRRKVSERILQLHKSRVHYKVVDVVKKEKNLI